MNDYLDAAVLRGKTIVGIHQIGSDRVELSTSDGKCFVMTHNQECCESVNIHDIQGSLESLVGKPLTVSREESSREEWPADVPKSEYEDSFTWTTYFFETEDAKVLLRWLGTSNGYYGESVQLEEVEG